ncbi:MAG: hypothetical protein Q9179_007966 [Wetmoreana sp. 5 TL-2023]
MDQASKTAGQAEERDRPWHVGSIAEKSPESLWNLMDAQIASKELSMKYRFAQLEKHVESQVHEQFRSIKKLETRVRILENPNANYSSNIESTQEAYKKLASECAYYKAQCHQLANTLGQNNDTTLVID